MYFAVGILAVLPVAIFASCANDEKIDVGQHFGKEIYDKNPKMCDFGNEKSVKWEQDTGYFVSCLSNEIINADLKNPNQTYKRNLDRTVAAFNNTGCFDNYLNDNTTSEKSTDSSKTMAQFFEDTSNFQNVISDPRLRISSNPADKEHILKFVNILEDLIWNVLMPNTNAAKCMLKNLQIRFNDMLAECVSTEMQTPFVISNKYYGLIDVPEASKIPHLKELVRMFVKASLLTRKCDLDDCGKNPITAELQSYMGNRICLCAQDSIVSCPANFNFACPFFQKCVKKVAQNPMGMLDGIQGKIVECFKETPEQLAAVGTVAQELIGSIKQVSDTGKGEMAKYVGEIVAAVFPTNFCKNCHLDV